MAVGYFKHGFRGGTDKIVENNGIYLEFYHLPTKRVVKFKAFITDYSEAYNVSFNEQDVYGRMDPIATYQGTKRKINLAWTVVAESHAEAWENWKRVQDYIKMMYPSYKKFIYEQKKGSKTPEKFSATTLASPPLLKMKFMNLIADTSVQSLEKTQKRSRAKNWPMRKFVNYTGNGNAAEAGLLVVPGSLQINPQFTERAPWFYGNSKKLDPHVPPPLGTPRPEEYEDYVASSPFIIPHEIQMSSDFTVLHQHDMGTQTTVDVGANSKAGKKVANAKKAIKAAAKSYAAAKTLSAGLAAAQKGTAARAKLANAQKIQKNLTKNKKTNVDPKGFGNFPYGNK